MSTGDLQPEFVRDQLALSLHVIRCWLEWGPCDDGTPEGEAFEDALGAMHRFLRLSSLPVR